MKNNFFYLAYILFFIATITSCKSDDESYVPTSPVNYDIEQIPYATLSEYNFFDGNIADLNPVYGVLPYDPISHLFTDYAEKKRFVWMPSDVSASYDLDHTILDFPEGAMIIKNFYYNNVLPENTTKIIETRMLIKKGGEWIFANYVWNNEQTDAVLDNNSSTIPIEWNQDGEIKNINYRVPSQTECLTCHKLYLNPTPIGVKPQNMNSIYSYDGTEKNQLEKWVEMGYLNESIPASIETIVDWEDPLHPLDLRARSYLDINCAHCHTDGAHCSYRPIRFGFNETTDPDNLGVCVTPDEDIDPSLTHVVSPGRSERSVLSFRLNSNDEATRMPLIGRTIAHDEGVQLIEEWINSLTTTCD